MRRFSFHLHFITKVAYATRGPSKDNGGDLNLTPHRSKFIGIISTPIQFLPTQDHYFVKEFISMVE